MSAQATRVPFSFPHEAMDYEALSIVERLQSGHELFRGRLCARCAHRKDDTEDFDIATDARALKSAAALS